MKKTHKVCMLPTEKASLIGKYIDTNQLVFNNPNHKDIPRGEFQHLYILSSEPINSGDWCIDIEDNTLFQVKEQGHSGLLRSNTDSYVEDSCKKIIATTDKSLKLKWDNLQSVVHNGVETNLLPQIPESFIQEYIAEYNKGNVITEVELEYEEIMTGSSIEGGQATWTNKLTTTSNNEVIISLPLILDNTQLASEQFSKEIERNKKVKMYTRDEVIILMKLSIKRGSTLEFGNLPFEELIEPEEIWINKQL